MKNCRKCKNDFELDQFPKDKTTKDGYDLYCKFCKREKIKQIYYKNPEREISKRKKLNKENKEKYSITNKKRYEENKEVILKKSRQHYKDNKKLHYERCKISKLKKLEEYNLKHFEYRKNNKAKIAEYYKKYSKTERFKELQKARNNKKQNNPLYIIKKSYGDRIYKFFNSTHCRKNKKSQEILGCTWDEAIKWIESHFQENMSWLNKKEWHIDHAIPLEWAQNEQDMYYLNHYTNLKPMLKKDNLTKSHYYGEVWDGKKWIKLSKQEYNNKSHGK